LGLKIRPALAVSVGIVVLSLTSAVIFQDRILWKLGDILVRAEAPQKADMAEVLGGDYPGRRILKACELVRNGFVPRAFVTGGGHFYGMHESKLSIDFAGRRGCPADFFIQIGYPAQSTTDEIVHLLPELRRLGVHKLLVVTSPSHTGRAARVFHRLAPDMEVHTIAAPDPKWNNGYWWKIREGRKTWLLEVTKNMADFLGI
jgi:uncharacterized SAM-binding protein YcdF (DUF218 family)